MEPGSASVGRTSALIVAKNKYRRGLFIRNISSAPVFLAFGYPAVLNKGIALYEKESYSMTADNFSRTEVNAISSGDALVSIQEYDGGEAVETVSVK